MRSPSPPPGRYGSDRGGGRFHDRPFRPRGDFRDPRDSRDFRDSREPRDGPSRRRPDDRDAGRDWGTYARQRDERDRMRPRERDDHAYRPTRDRSWEDRDRAPRDRGRDRSRSRSAGPSELRSPGRRRDSASLSPVKRSVRDSGSPEEGQILPQAEQTPARPAPARSPRRFSPPPRRRSPSPPRRYDRPSDYDPRSPRRDYRDRDRDYRDTRDARDYRGPPPPSRNRGFPDSRRSYSPRRSSSPSTSTPMSITSRPLSPVKRPTSPHPVPPPRDTRRQHGDMSPSDRERPMLPSSSEPPLAPAVSAIPPWELRKASGGRPPPDGPRRDRFPGPPSGPRSSAIPSGPPPAPFELRQNHYSAAPAAPYGDREPIAGVDVKVERDLSPARPAIALERQERPVNPYAPPPGGMPLVTPGSAGRMSWSERKAAIKTETNSGNSSPMSTSTPAQISRDRPNPYAPPPVAVKDEPMEVDEVKVAKFERDPAEIEAERIMSELPILKVPFIDPVKDAELAAHEKRMQTLTAATLRARQAYRHAAISLADAEAERFAATERRKVTEAQLEQAAGSTLGMGGILGAL